MEPNGLQTIPATQKEFTDFLLQDLEKTIFLEILS